MCAMVPMGYNPSCPGSSSQAVRCVKTPTCLSPEIALSIRATELSRATASGMNELGNSTVSRNGNTGISAGTAGFRSDAAAVVVSCSAKEHLQTSQAPPPWRSLHMYHETGSPERRSVHVQEEPRWTPL